MAASSRLAALTGDALGEYAKLKAPLQAQLSAGAGESAEGRYWKRFRRPLKHQLATPCTSLHFSPAGGVEGVPHGLVCATSLDVAAYGFPDFAKKRVVGKLPAPTSCVRLRGDGRLVAAGDKRGTLRAYEVKRGAQLRAFAGHTDSVRAVEWGADGLSLFTGSADRTVRLWDLATGGPSSAAFEAHADTVTCVARSPLSSADLWVSGGYDHKLNVWDARALTSGAAASQTAAMTFDHGAPVEACLMLPGGGLLLSAGGNECKVWDLLSGGRLVHKFSAHQRTVVALALDGTQTRILSGGLDGHLKIYDVATYRVVHGLKYASPVLGVGVSPDNELLAVACADGALSVRRRETRATSAGAGSAWAATAAGGTGGGGSAAGTAAAKGGTLRYYNRGKNVAPSTDDYAVHVQRKQRLQPYDKALRRFAYGTALDDALATRQPIAVIAVLEELTNRQGLEAALGGRDEVTLEPFLSFLARYITSPRYASLLLDVASVVLHLYGPALGRSEAIDELFARLARCVKGELRLQKSMLRLLGGLDAVMSASAATSASAIVGDEAAAAAEGAAAEGAAAGKEAGKEAVKASSKASSKASEDDVEMAEAPPRKVWSKRRPRASSFDRGAGFDGRRDEFLNDEAGKLE